MKNIVMVVPDGHVNITSITVITSIYEILNWADCYWQQKGNRSVIKIQIASFLQSPEIASGLFTVHSLNLNETDDPDLIVIPSLSDEYEIILKQNDELIKWIREKYKNGAEVASVCTGAFLLGATGLLNGKKCSTHWDAAANLKKMFPGIHVHTDVLTIAARGIYTNGGGYSFLNMALFLVEKYFDRQTAIICSKMFQIDMDRTSQSPFAIFRAQKSHNDEVISNAQTYIEENLCEKISFEALASKLAVSRRNFDRRFTKATGNTPVEYLQRVKVEVAKNALEDGRKTVYEVMNDVGYADDKAFREVFKKITGLSPAEYKAKYNKEA